MPEVSVTTEFKAPAATVWAAVGDFCGIGKWLPGIQRVEAENEGKRRRVVLPDGKAVVEDEVSRDEAAMSLSYRVVEGPMPFTGYVSTISVRPEASGCSVHWVGKFTPIGPEEKVARLVKGIYGSAMAGLKNYLGES
ncbi:MAG: hypothetical protein A3I00_06710 [Betaproteobacteria bacterium RIFCSPLOWO2_02_FULL_64_12]|nr:MAG: hypothetical protein A3I00_06710 [Betaproteobacteria bacterium RIFCSPLOWO2_02_FULL_64_12]